jgi:hypothetical protein
MKKRLQGSFVLLFIAPFAIIQDQANKKEPPDSNYDSISALKV